MTSMLNCANCGKETNEYSNYCNWECNIAHAEKNGAKVFTPNYLPISCINDNWLLEHEHALHKDYKFPVVAQYTGDIEDVTDRYDDGSIIYVQSQETHALIYSDDAIALTLYECSYYTWLLRTGEALSGALYPNKSQWFLTKKSIKDIVNGVYLHEYKNPT